MLKEHGTTLAVRLLDIRPSIFSTKQPTVLLESPFDPLRRQMNSVLLTVDLTKAVADEAIERSDSIIVAYRASTPATLKRSRLTRRQA